MGIGVDIEDVSRFEKLDRATDRVFLRNIFTESELRYCFARKNKAAALAGRFSAKESVLKALGAFKVRALRFSEIEIKNDARGLPNVTIGAKNLNIYTVKISISHAKGMAFTAAIATKK